MVCVWGGCLCRWWSSWLIITMTCCLYRRTLLLTVCTCAVQVKWIICSTPRRTSVPTVSLWVSLQSSTTHWNIQQQRGGKSRNFKSQIRIYLFFYFYITCTTLSRSVCLFCTKHYMYDFNAMLNAFSLSWQSYIRNKMTCGVDRLINLHPDAPYTNCCVPNPTGWNQWSHLIQHLFLSITNFSSVNLNLYDPDIQSCLI